jgi:hypothetical protein
MEAQREADEGDSVHREVEALPVHAQDLRGVHGQVRAALLQVRALGRLGHRAEARHRVRRGRHHERGGFHGRGAQVAATARRYRCLLPRAPLHRPRPGGEAPATQVQLEAEDDGARRVLRRARPDGARGERAEPRGVHVPARVEDGDDGESARAEPAAGGFLREHSLERRGHV